MSDAVPPVDATAPPAFDAERFLRTGNLAGITSQIDPLSLLEEYQDIGGDEDTDDVVASAYVAVSVSLDEVTPHAEALEERAAPATITHPALD